jgi:HAD superfamily hydrolase (TIGR01459 family)
MIHTTLDDLAARFDAFLVDQFGVLLDGVAAYPFAPAALARLAAMGKPVILLSNSGRRSAPNAARLLALGFAPTSFATVMSSGEAAWSALQHRIGTTLPKGARVWLHGRDDEAGQIAGLDLQRVGQPIDADLLLLAGSRGDVMTLDDYVGLLGSAAQARVPMLCTNPDMQMLTPLGLRFGPGRIADTYAAMGGVVEWIGKPHPLIYAAAARLIPGIPAARVLCIGDSPAHDVLGGARAGHATALVCTGLHAGLSDEARLAVCKEEGAMPDFIIPAFDFRD